MLCLILGGRLIQTIDLYTAIYGFTLLLLNFQDFAQIRENKFPQIFSKQAVRENKFPRNFSKHTVREITFRLRSEWDYNEHYGNVFDLFLKDS